MHSGCLNLANARIPYWTRNVEIFNKIERKINWRKISQVMKAKALQIKQNLDCKIPSARRCLKKIPDKGPSAPPLNPPLVSVVLKKVVAIQDWQPEWQQLIIIEWKTVWLRRWLLLWLWKTFSGQQQYSSRIQSTLSKQTPLYGGQL